MITSKLIYWYLKNKRDLPWRKTKDPYLVWLSEIMLQQTRVAQGLPYFISFTTNFETVFDLAKADQTTVLKLWQGLGYYSRARNLHFTAKQVANDFNGVFPNTYKELLKLKGIGDYTASAIASVCYDEPVAVVDGNVYRVLARYFGIKTAINSSKGIKEFKELAQTLIDVSQPGMYNQAIMDFGALQCKPQNPLCDSCPLSESCVALDKKLIKELPVKEKKIKVKKRYFNYLVVVTDDNKTNIEQRIGKGIWQGLYQFPLIETTTAINETQLIEQPEFAKLFPKETILTLFNQKDIVHKLSHQHLSTKFWIVKTTNTSEKTILWNDIKQYPVPVLIDNFLNEFLTKA
ncbi:A/G-specific adenine glycosylase [Tenacibaculum dicentrarchi]|uniref:Adenine DNA glycosylase n=1 Tax=Tenacibaculum dicentrarchi TaxID=669041 RepID=A0ABM9NQE1_9FLAO|nr:A/G-specific adenine glycosylase [Tenacibaculum dicentrarchi]MCD8413902.1 A/G-specific adenine glycosylase [Tenacibaculum dicentrarchi]MCD8419460.1 A/G-specific adenine glycosylase [Tenacibaculum dicentrarchi]MCD8436205.1 A/G-specific adenine glycosylase [Tenacibaculum dicentrarchi]MCD8448872.1 A/G-specific adenine glycosylase [Tenacibaculum dicentrarchi]